jgi:hypothetical protein
LYTGNSSAIFGGVVYTGKSSVVVVVEGVVLPPDVSSVVPSVVSLPMH